MQLGQGTHVWMEPRGEGKYLRNRYEGEWHNGQKHGIGVFYYSNGSKYVGNWQNNVKQGYGLFIEDNGFFVFGSFTNDRLT